jgi:hypothetical protein
VSRGPHVGDIHGVQSGAAFDDRATQRLYELSGIDESLTVDPDADGDSARGQRHLLAQLRIGEFGGRAELSGIP